MRTNAEILANLEEAHSHLRNAAGSSYLLDEIIAEACEVDWYYADSLRAFRTPNGVTDCPRYTKSLSAVLDLVGRRAPAKLEITGYSIGAFTVRYTGARGFGSVRSGYHGFTERSHELTIAIAKCVVRALIHHHSFPPDQ